MKSADDKQVGGDHYINCEGDQHWTVMAKCGADYFAGCITKYVHRFPNKNGLQDLQKAMHFIDKCLETGSGNVEYPNITSVKNWVCDQRHDKLTALENSYMRLVLHSILCEQNMWEAKKALRNLIDLYAASEPGARYANQD